MNEVGGPATIRSLFGSALQLRPYQQEAIAAWRKAGDKGVLEMGTGTGKTLTSLAAVHQAWPKYKMVLVACPTRILVDQWVAEIKRAFPTAPVFAMRGAAWEKAYPIDEVPVFVVGTLNGMCRPRFAGWVTRNVPKDASLLIIDEAHRAGSVMFSKILDLPVAGRLGLSATPHRTWDERGNHRLSAGLGDTVFQFGIGDAIANGHLSEYRYHIHPVPMSPAEREAYQELSLKLLMTLGAKGFDGRKQTLPAFMAALEERDPEGAQIVKNIMIQRTKFHKEAIGKESAILDVVRGNDLDKCLVYCNTIRHVGIIRRVLKDEGHVSTQYTSAEGTLERKLALEAFREGMVTFLVAIKCLDEGVDLPDCRSAVIVSSSATTREFIQRRGRLLRKAAGKTLADIHDLLVLPVDPESFHGGLGDADAGLIGKELRRAAIFADHAVNREEVRARIRDIADKLGISPDLALNVEFVGLASGELEDDDDGE